MDTSSPLLKLAELYEFTLADGVTTQYLTTYGKNILFESDAYMKAPITRTRNRQTSDLSVGETRLTFPRMSPWITPDSILRRYLDKATLKVTWVDRDDHNNKRVAFRGIAGQVSFNEFTVDITFKNRFVLFRKQIPIRMYTEGCGHQMYDGRCKLIQSNYEVTGTATVPVSGQTKSNLFDASRTEADGYFDLGIIEFTSGQNAGLRRWVKRYEFDGFYFIGERIDMFEDLPYLPQTGDTYKMIPHCKKTYQSCKDDFSNELNFGGFEDIPDIVEILA